MTSCSHGTQIAYSAACAIACGIAQALTEDADVHTILKACVYGARRGEEIGLKEARIAAGARVLPKILKAIEIAYAAESMEQAEQMLNDEMGTDSSAIAQACGIAIGLFAAADGDCVKTILGGANIGGDTDTLACIAGMLAGAYRGYSSLPPDWCRTFAEANPAIDFAWATDRLLEIVEKKYNTVKF